MKLRQSVLSSLTVLLLGGLIVSCEGSVTGNERLSTEPGTNRNSIHIVINSLGSKFPAGMDENNNPYLTYIEKSTGLDIKVTLPPQEVYEEKLNATMSSGKLPDMLHVYKPVWLDLNMKRGTLMPLEDLIDKYGPDLKKKIPQEAWSRVSYEGRIYAVPSLNEVKGVELIYARKDWLDRLGLKKPVTLDEYYEVMKAFTFDDPDGNGLDDTIGLTLLENMGRSAPFFGAFGTQLDSWILKDGKLVNGSLMPETKQALAFLNRLYEDKLLDQEFPLNRNSNLDEKIINGTVGLFSAAWYDTRGPIAENKRKDPQAEWIALDYPTGPNGHRGVYDRDLIRGYNVIPVGAANPEGVIRFLNFVAGQGHRDLKLGFENEIWTMKDGKMVTNFAEHDKHVYRGMYQSLVDVDNPELSKTRLDSLGDFHLYDNLMMVERNLIRNEFFGTPTPAMSLMNENPWDLREKFIRIVMGLDPLDSFEQLAQEWNEKGGKDVTREVNAWYRENGRKASGGTR